MGDQIYQIKTSDILIYKLPLCYYIECASALGGLF